MRVLADEHFPYAAVQALREHGHDVLWVRTEFAGRSDHEILQLAGEEQRLILTFDKDFGELAFHQKLPAPCGVVLFRLRIPSPEIAAERLLKLLESRSDWSERFTVVEDDRIRIRPMPTE